ncbi:MAG: hypothetical protein R3247_04240 [Rhodothermales bacterium]|nr:hypothetical protein [Rhodothermales bacterium]
MDRKPTRNGYSYRNAAWPYTRRQAPPVAGMASAPLQFRLYGLAWHIRPLYEQAGKPFGTSDRGLLLWVEFGRRSRAN